MSARPDIAMQIPLSDPTLPRQGRHLEGSRPLNSSSLGVRRVVSPGGDALAPPTAAPSTERQAGPADPGNAPPALHAQVGSPRLRQERRACRLTVVAVQPFAAEGQEWVRLAVIRWRNSLAQRISGEPTWASATLVDLTSPTLVRSTTAAGCRSATLTRSQSDCGLAPNDRRACDAQRQKPSASMTAIPPQTMQM